MGSSASSARRRSQGVEQTPVYDRSKPMTPRGARYRAGRPPNTPPEVPSLPISHISGNPPQMQPCNLQPPPPSLDHASFSAPHPRQYFSTTATGSPGPPPNPTSTPHPYEQWDGQHADADRPWARPTPYQPTTTPAQLQTTGHGYAQPHMQNRQDHWPGHAVPGIGQNIPSGAGPPQAPLHPPAVAQHTMNVVHGPTNNVQHVEQGNFGPILGKLTQISNSYNYTSDVSWESLPRQRDTSGHRSVYLGGSRDEDVKTIRTWVQTPSSELTLWIYGPAGIGKSTLAREVCRDLGEAGLLGAFVPLSSLPSDARGPESVIKMIAREIGETHRQAAPAITEAISQCKGRPVRTHLNIFVGEPLRALQRLSPVAVVLDAFDEWEFADILIKDLDCLAPLSSIVRFILLGRSDPRSLGHESAFTRPYPLQPVSQEVMEKYFAREFEMVKWDHGRKPSAKDVSRLAEQADGLFIWARIACSLMGKGLGLTSPNKTLEGILYSREKFGENGDLGNLYGGALQWLFPGEDEQAALKQYLGMILILQEPLSSDNFSFFSGLPSRSVETIQTRLGVLQIRNTMDNQPMVHPATSSFHLSFVEYLQHASTSQSASFATPCGPAHSDLAKACLQVLTTHPSTSQGLTQRQWYAVKHWVLHTSEGAPAVKPGSSSDWEATELCSALTETSTITWHWWCQVILGFFIPGYDIGEVSGGDSASDFLRHVAWRLDERNLAMIPFRIACLSVATRLQPDDAYGWCDLGWAYLRFAEVSTSSDLVHQAVAAYRNAAAAGGSSDSAVMGGLGSVLQERFLCLRIMSDLDQSILLLRKALALCPLGHLNRPPPLTNLANSLMSRFGVTNSFEDLQEAIVLQKEALALCPSGHPHHSVSLSNLASSLWLRFGVTNSFEDLQEAIVLAKEALALCPSGHPDRSKSLRNLASSLWSRFGVTNSFEDLQAAIVLQKEALALLPSGHPDRSYSLGELASSLWSRFGVTNSFEDLQAAIVLQKEALALCPSGHPGRSKSLRNLACSLWSRFEVTNSFEDLQEAIVLEKEALALRPSGHPHRSGSLNNLGSFLHSRFKVTNTFGDLQEAITLLREALVLRPPGHRYRSQTLENLADALESRSRVTGSVEDMYEASTLREEVASSC